MEQAPRPVMHGCMCKWDSDLAGRLQSPCCKGPSARYLGTRGLGNSKHSTGFGEVYDY